MAVERSHLIKTVLRKVTGAPSGGTCAVYEDVPEGNVSTLTTVPLYSSPIFTNNTILANPFTFSQGQVDFYTQFPIRLNLVVTPDPIAPATVGVPQTFYSIDAWPSAIDVSMEDQGLLVNRPAPAFQGLRYYATDNNTEYYCTGTAWVVSSGSGGGLDTSFLLMGA